MIYASMKKKKTIIEPQIRQRRHSVAIHTNLKQNVFFYFVVNYIEGTRLCQAHRLPLQFKTHKHTSLKFSNLMVTPKGIPAERKTCFKR